MNFEGKISQKAANLIRKGERVGIGVSGGVDSIVLLDLLAYSVQRTAYSDPRSVIVLHLNHKLRGTESDRDEVFVKQIAKKYGLPCVSTKKNILALSKKTKKSIEDMGRLARLEFFESAARKYKFRKILLAHHEDDLVETILMRLFRGTGVKGFKGMREKTRIGNLELIRPLLGISKKEILDYARQHKLRFRADASNQDDKFLRNKIRLQVLPYLEKTLGPSLKPKLIGFRERLLEAEELIHLESERAFRKVWRKKKGSYEARRASFLELPAILQYETLARAYREISGKVLEEAEWKRIRQTDDSHQDDSHRFFRRINLRGNCFFENRGKTVVIISHAD